MRQKSLKSFKDLTVWQKTVDLASLLYEITDKFPKSELYGLANQMRRAVISISSNIAEGFKREHKKEKLQFYNIAYGSCAELESPLEIAQKLHFLSESDYQKLLLSITEISKMIDGLIKSAHKSEFPTKFHIASIVLYLLIQSSILYPGPSPALAAELFLETKNIEIPLNTEFKIDFFINTENKDINAVEGEIIYPEEWELKDINDGNSVINFWLQRPSLNSKPSILYSGIIPGGYRGNKGFIFSMLFEGRKEGSELITINNQKVLLNDGVGTETKSDVKNLEVKILDRKEVLYPKSYILYPADNEPPESFVLEIASDPVIFEGKHFLVFATQDKGLGISHYEVLETRSKILGTWLKRQGTWIRAESPYVLRDQELRSYVLVKVVDKAGNTRIERIAPQNPLKWYENYEIWIMIVVGLAIAYAIWMAARRKRQRQGARSKEQGTRSKGQR